MFHCNLDAWKNNGETDSSRGDVQKNNLNLYSISNFAIVSYFFSI